MLYLLALPFQLVSTMGYSTIICVFIAAFTLYGVEGMILNTNNVAIGREIENPFGYDLNDLHMQGFENYFLMQVFCETLRVELHEMTDHATVIGATPWETPVKLNDLNQLASLSRSIKKSSNQ